MRKNHLIVRRIAVPILTLALLAGSWAPAVDVKSAVSESAKGSAAVVEVFKGAGIARAATNWKQVPKNYNVKVFIDGMDNELSFPPGMGKPFIALNRTFVPYRIKKLW